MAFEPARQRYIASQKPNALRTELCERCFQHFFPTFGLERIEIAAGVFLHPSLVCAHERKMLITMHVVNVK